jgi:hypothetical protein
MSLADNVDIAPNNEGPREGRATTRWRRVVTVLLRGLVFGTDSVRPRPRARGFALFEREEIFLDRD